MSTNTRPDNMPLAFGCWEPSGPRLILRPCAFIIGSLVAHAAFSLMAGLMAYDFWSTTLLISIFGAIPVLLMAAIFGIPTALALRRVPSQSVHVLAFAIAGMAPGLLMSGGQPAYWVISGLAAGVGRFSIWKLATIKSGANDLPGNQSPE